LAVVALLWLLGAISAALLSDLLRLTHHNFEVVSWIRTKPRDIQFRLLLQSGNDKEVASIELRIAEVNMSILRRLARALAFPSATAILFLCSSLGQNPPQPAARIQVQSTSVVVDVVVTGKKGEAVTKLEAKDFKVFEDNTPQTIVGFEPPPSAQSGASPAASVIPPGSDATPRRLNVGPTHFVTLVIDMGGLTQASYALTAKAALQYIENNLAPEDCIAVDWIGSTLHSALLFTNDKAKAVEAIQNLKANVNDAAFSSGERARTMQEITQLRQREAQLRSAGDLASGAMADMDHAEIMAVQGNMFMQSSFQARAVFQALRAIAQAAAAIPGRKTVVLFSEGFIHSPETASQSNAVIAAANRANVVIYIVDPLGLSGGRQEGILRAEDESGMAPVSRGRGRQITPDSRNSQAADLARSGLEISGGYNKFDAARRLDDDGVTDDLSAVAVATGGLLFKNSNDILHSLNLIDRDLREYYTLVYHPTNESFDGSFRRIRVEVAGSGYKIRTRKGYWAMPPSEEALMTPAAAQMLASVANGTLKSTVQAKINAALLLAPTGDASIPVSIWIPGEASWVTKVSNERFNAGGTVIIVARDAQGHVIGVQQRFIDLRMNKQQWQQFQTEGLVLNASLNVPKVEPHSVQAIVQFSNGAASIADAKVAIPKAEKSPLVLTSLLVTPRVDAVKEPDDTNPLQVETYQLVLPSNPLFAKSSKMTVYLGMLNYPHNANGGLQFDLSFAIKSGDKVVRDLQPAELHPFPKLPNAAFLLTQYDLTGLVAGSYTLEAKLHDLVRGTDTFQVAPFTIQ
jgi:VWFA-related protein